MVVELDEKGNVEVYSEVVVVSTLDVTEVRLEENVELLKKELVVGSSLVEVLLDEGVELLKALVVGK